MCSGSAEGGADTSERQRGVGGGGADAYSGSADDGADTAPENKPGFRDVSKFQAVLGAGQT